MSGGQDTAADLAVLQQQQPFGKEADGTGQACRFLRAVFRPVVSHCLSMPTKVSFLNSYVCSGLIKTRFYGFIGVLSNTKSGEFTWLASPWLEHVGTKTRMAFVSVKARLLQRPYVCTPSVQLLTQLFPTPRFLPEVRDSLQACHSIYR